MDDTILILRESLFDCMRILNRRESEETPFRFWKTVLQISNSDYKEPFVTENDITDYERETLSYFLSRSTTRLFPTCSTITSVRQIKCVAAGMAYFRIEILPQLFAALNDEENEFEIDTDLFLDFQHFENYLRKQILQNPKKKTFPLQSVDDAIRLVDFDPRWTRKYEDAKEFQSGTAKEYLLDGE